MTRFIGIRHRRKATREGEARPTMVAILKTDGQIIVHELENDTAENDFLTGRFPTAWRAVAESEEIVWFDREKAPHGFHQYQCKWRKVKADEDASTLHPSHLRRVEDEKGIAVMQVLQKVPSAFDGYKAGDIGGTTLGGSGDRYAAALSRQGEIIGAEMYRIPPFVFAGIRDAMQANKDDDHINLAMSVKDRRGAFYMMRRRDRDGIRIKEELVMRQDAMKDRIRCEQRILQSLVGRIFLSEEGRYPEGVIEDQFDREKANDKIFEALSAEEARRAKALEKTVKGAPIWDAIFGPIEGCGPRLAAGLIAPISDIRRFRAQPDPATMAEIKQRCNQLEHEGRFKQDLDKVAERITPGMPHFQQVQIVRSWKRAAGKEAEAKLLDEAISLHQQRAQLRKKAYAKGMAKLRKFCGVHVNNTIGPDGKDTVPKNLQFPRRRAGQVASWNPIARQSLYLLGEQFNRRPDSEWGKVLLHYKLVLRKTHPDVVEENGKKRYTNGHIHKMAIWKTLSKFVDKLYRTWTDLEEEQQRTGRDILPSSPPDKPQASSGDGANSDVDALATEAA